MIELYNALKFITLSFFIQNILTFNLGVAFLKSVSIHGSRFSCQKVHMKGCRSSRTKAFFTRQLFSMQNVYTVWSFTQSFMKILMKYKTVSCDLFYI